MSDSSCKKPIPIVLEPAGQVCPVCGKRSYSPGGVHPQCAVHQADAPRCEQLKSKKELKTTKPRQRSWGKKCPKCAKEVHVRRSHCDCGHAFFR